MATTQKALLKLRIPQGSNIMGLSRDTFELAGCRFEMSRGQRSNGEPHSDITGGIIILEVSGTPADELVAWMWNRKTVYNGEVALLDTGRRGETREKVYFDEARCINFRVNYSDEASTVTEITLLVERIGIGESWFENMVV